MVAEGDMAHYTRLSCHDALLSDMGATGHTHLCSHGGIPAYYHIVRHLAQVVYLDTLPDNGGSY